MKKLFLILSVALFALGTVNAFAQEAAAAAETQLAGDSLHHVMMQKFLEGGWAWMLPILIFLIIGLAVAIERILYLLAFTVLGFAGACSKLKGGFFIGTVVGSVARFLVHYVVGATIWAEYMPETFFGLTMTSPWFYSALYNGSFMLIDMVLVLIVGALLWKPLKKYITGEDLRGAASAKNEG